MGKHTGRMVPKREEKPRSPKFGERKIVRQKRTKTTGNQPSKPKRKGGFPDLSGDGKVTQKDILMGRGVIKRAGGGSTMPGMKKRVMAKRGKSIKKRVKKNMGGAMKKRVMKRGGGMMKKPMLKSGGKVKK